MSNYESPVDHFSERATAAYTALIQARKNLAWHSIASRQLLGTHSEVLDGDSPVLEAYQGAISDTVWMYAAGCRDQGRPDAAIKQLLVPRLVDEHRLFGDEELGIFLTEAGQGERHRKLVEGIEEDRSHMTRYVDETAMQEDLEDAIRGTIYQIGSVIVSRSNIHAC